MFKIKVTGYKSLFLLYFVSYFHTHTTFEFINFTMKKSEWDIQLVTAMTSVAHETNRCAKNL